MALGWRSSYLRYRDVLAIYKRRRDVKMFLEIILSATAISFFAIFAIRPTLLTIGGLVTQIREKEGTLSRVNQKVKDLSTIQGILRQETRIPLIKEAVPDAPPVEVLIQQIIALANSHSVDILGVSIGEFTLVGKKEIQKPLSKEIVSLPENSPSLDFSISMTGSYSSLLEFIADIERLRMPIKIDNVGINSSKSESKKVLVLVISARNPYLGK